MGRWVDLTSKGGFEDCIIFYDLLDIDSTISGVYHYNVVNGNITIRREGVRLRVYGDSTGYFLWGESHADNYSPYFADKTSGKLKFEIFCAVSNEEPLESRITIGATPTGSIADNQAFPTFCIDPIQQKITFGNRKKDISITDPKRGHWYKIEYDFSKSTAFYYYDWQFLGSMAGTYDGGIPWGVALLSDTYTTDVYIRAIKIAYEP